uniref:Uncharacterized protein n=1 Tax=Knipowitschia caucasica TaxID=637954 RepID=A0AAV2IUU8_KNICA
MSAPVTPQEHVSSPQITEGWKIEPDPTEAVKIFKQDILQKSSDVQYTSQIILGKINWPLQDEDGDSDVSLEDACRITGYLRTFIENEFVIIQTCMGSCCASRS